MKKSLVMYVPGLLFILFFATCSFVFFYLSPESVISFVGVENGYLLIFFLAFLGGLTTFSGIPYHLVLITLAAGGLNPLLLGGATATAVILGDTTSYYFGYHGRSFVPGRVQHLFQKWSSFLEQYPRLLPIFFFLYGALVPASNDVITIPMGLAHYPFWWVMIPLWLGNMVFNIALAFLGVYAYGFLQAIFWI